MRPSRIVALLLGCALASWDSRAGGDGIRIPDELAGFRSWVKLTAEPQMVPYQLSILCAAQPPTLKNWERHGLHTNRSIMVYANPMASAALRDWTTTAFPVGATIAKEKLRGSAADGVAFMVKHPSADFPESGGWEFLYYPASAAKPSYESCISCHRTGGSKDYVFGRYGQPDAK
jgi:hypothetical protein